MFRGNLTNRFWKAENRTDWMQHVMSIALLAIYVIALDRIISVWFMLLIYLLKAWISIIPALFTLLIHLLRGWGSILWFIRCVLRYYLSACYILLSLAMKPEGAALDFFCKL